MMQEWAKLSEMGGIRAPDVCQSCGRGTEFTALLRWQECDQADRPTRTLVILCRECSGNAIEAHPRLYRDVSPNAPWPGAMQLCVDCKLRDGLKCTDPNAANGIGIVQKAPMHGFVDFGASRGSPRHGRRVTLYSEPPTACASRQPTTDEAE